MSRGPETFDRIESQPDEIKDITLWVRKALDLETARKMLFVERGARRVPVAEVVRSGVGLRDDRGDFPRGLGARDLAGLGITFPPYHRLCRTTTVADV